MRQGKPSLGEKKQELGHECTEVDQKRTKVFCVFAEKTIFAFDLLHKKQKRYARISKQN